MKLKAAAVLSAVLCALSVSLPVLAVQTAAYDAPETELTQYHTASNAEEAAQEIRSCLRDRTEEFTVAVSSDFVSTNEDISNIIAMAVKETDRSDEGDYLRWSISSYGYEPVYTNRRLTGLKFNFGYNTDSAKETVLNETLARIEADMHLSGKSEYEKIDAVYSFITASVAYSTDLTGRDIFSAYGAAVNGNAVCHGYAQLMYRMLRDCGISCRFIPGCGNGGDHAWNIAAIDGVYYWLDSTWDSNISPSSRAFFLRGTTDFDSAAPNSSHDLSNWDELDSALFSEYIADSFFESYPMSETAYIISSGAAFSTGDVDGNGLVDSADASAILQAYAALSVGEPSYFTDRQNSAADVNGDSLVDSADATYVLMYYSHLATGGTMSISDFLAALRA
ncbi:MAG: hypothetical protein IJ874_03710 [Ruminococcus sp.]|nr:hypothetical protein [Ruminococcus sp.]